MFHNKLKYFILTLALGACSGSGTAESILETIPQPKIDQEAGLLQQSVPEHVPALDSDQLYYGVYPLEIDKKYELIINEAWKSQVIDLEFVSTKDTLLNISDLAVFAVGDCSDFSTTYTWFIMGSDNEVLSSQTIEILSSFWAFKNERAILRITHSNSTGCSYTSTQLSVGEIN